MLTGYNGIKCIECGGPEPGVGCAGRGVIQMLNLLREQGLDTKQFDYVFFDVLGDVVCGGFAVPMREGYADEVYIVTSGEIASLYAANNIAKGIKRFSTSHGKLGGLIGNGRGTKNEQEVIATFAQLIGTEMITFIPKSELIVQAEIASKPIMNFVPNSTIADAFKTIANHIERKQAPVVPKPLTDKELDCFLYEHCYNTEAKEHSSTKNLQQPQPNEIHLVTRKNLIPDKKTTSCYANRAPVQGCSLAGAFSAVRKIKDTVTIMHAPQGCATVSFSGHLSRAAYLPANERRPPNLLCTNMQETDVIFGGLKNLQETVLKVHKKFPSHVIFIITSCPAGIIGDDINQVVDELKDKIQLYHIPTDGVMNNGDFYTGVLNAHRVVAENLIDDSVTAEEGMVNIIGGQSIYPSSSKNSEAINYIFKELNITVNCSFIGETTTTQIKNFKKAAVNIPFSRDPLITGIASFLETRFSSETLKAPLPVGFEQTADFTRALGRRFNKALEAEELIKNARNQYENDLIRLRKYFSGKKALIFSSPSNIDWLISTMMDLQVDIPKIYSLSLFPSRETFSIKYSSKIPVENNYAIDKFAQTLLQDRPDFVLTAGSVSAFNSVPCDILPTIGFPFNPPYGFCGGLDYANRLYLKLKFSSIEGWKNDEKLFKCSA